MKSETPPWDLGSNRITGNCFSHLKIIFSVSYCDWKLSSILRGDHPLPSRLFEQTVGLHAFQKMVLFEPDDYWGVRQDKCISPFCRQENGNQSGCQEIVRAGAPAIYSGHLCVSSFSSPASWAGDSTDRWVGPCRWGRRFRQWGWRAAPGAFLH